jgi:selenide,water dikinase
MDTTRHVHVVLVGAGHVNLQVLLYLYERERTLLIESNVRLRVTVLSNLLKSWYSGMIPATVAHLYRPQEACIDVQLLCRASGARFLHGTLRSMHPEQRYLTYARSSLPSSPSSPTTASPFDQQSPSEPSTVVHATNNNEEALVDVDYDFVVLNLGSDIRLKELLPPQCTADGMPRLIVPTRPIGTLLERIRQYEERLQEWFAHLPRHPSHTEFHILTVGGGDAGFELTFAMLARFRACFGSHGILIRATVLHSSPMDNVHHALRKECAHLGITIVDEARVISVDAKDARVTTVDGHAYQFDVLCWATGASALPVMSCLGVDVTDEGWVAVRATMQSVSHSNVFAGGDCCQLVEHPDVPKAGVYAVRQGVAVAHNLYCCLYGNIHGMHKYRPQESFLRLVMTGMGRAIALKKWIPAFNNKLMWHWKDHIDRSWMHRFTAVIDEYQARLAEEAAERASNASHASGRSMQRRSAAHESHRASTMGLEDL